MYRRHSVRSRAIDRCQGKATRALIVILVILVGIVGYLLYMRYGVLMARKAWLGPEHILNCLSSEEIDGFFKNRKR